MYHFFVCLYNKDNYTAISFKENPVIEFKDYIKDQISTGLTIELLGRDLETLIKTNRVIDNPNQYRKYMNYYNKSVKDYYRDLKELYFNCIQSLYNTEDYRIGLMSISEEFETESFEISKMIEDLSDILGSREGTLNYPDINYDEALIERYESLMELDSGLKYLQPNLGLALYCLFYHLESSNKLVNVEVI